MPILTRPQVYKLIDTERTYQKGKWNAQTTTSRNEHSVEEWILYMEDYLAEAKHILCREARQDSDPKAMAILRKVTALGVAAMEDHGAPPRALPLGMFRIEAEVTPPTLPIPDGHRILRPDEKLLQGDMMYSRVVHRFVPTMRWRTFNGQQLPDRCYIRKIAPAPDVVSGPEIPEGYRVLHPDETLRRGDRFYVKSRKLWRNTIRPVESDQSKFHQPYIRKID